MSVGSLDISEWRESCATETTQAIYASFGSALLRFGDRGRQICHQDNLSHLDYLQASLDGASPELFVHYALWLKDVLNGRGVPTAHLSFCFDFMADFFQNQLQADQAIAVANVFDRTRVALIQGGPPVLYGTSRLPNLQQASHFQSLILQGQHKAALALVNESMQDGHSLTEVAVRLVQPALYGVGHAWQASKISVSQEHMATAISQNVLAGAYTKASFAPLNGNSAMFACVEGSFHSVGIQMLSDAFDTTGWTVFNLGSNLPTIDMVRQVDTQRPNLLCLSTSLPKHLAVVRSTIDALRAELGSACPTIWVGGLATMYVPQVVRLTGADGWASDAMHALDQL